MYMYIIIKCYIMYANIYTSLNNAKLLCWCISVRLVSFYSSNIR